MVGGEEMSGVASETSLLAVLNEVVLTNHLSRNLLNK